MMDDRMRLAKEAFARDGYVVVPGFLSRNETDEVRRNVDRYVAEVVPTLPPEAKYYENKNDRATLKQLVNLDRHDAYFKEFKRQRRFVELGELLLDGPVVVADVAWFNKPPRTGLATPAHQDGFYFMLEPNEAVTMWLAVDAVDEQNGCVRYVPGSHEKGLRPHARTQTLGFSQGITDYDPDDAAKEVAICAGPGDLIVHHSVTVHRADANLSARPRRALGLKYYSRRARADEGAVREYQRRLDADLAGENKI